MAQDIYINVNAQSPRSAFVKSELYPVPLSVYDVVYGDKLALNIYLVDGEGNFDSTSGLSGYTVKAAVGLLGESAAAMQDSWSLIANGWTGSIELNTTGIQNIIAGAESVEAWLEVEVTDPSGNRRTYGQQKIELLNQTINTGASVPTPESDYFTTTEANARFVQNRSAITALTGGGATSLDGIVTLDIAAGWLATVIIGGTIVRHYKLESGTDAESSPDVIRPDDYASGTNEKVWKLHEAITEGNGIVVENGVTHVAQAAAYTVGAMLYASTVAALALVAPNTTATNKFLTQSSSGAPAWATIQDSDLPLSGTDNYIPKWSSNTLTATSNIYDDGTTVIIAGAAANRTPLLAGSPLSVQVNAKDAVLELYGADSTINANGALYFYSSRGAIGSKLATTSGDFTGAVRGYGYDGSAFVASTQINFGTAGTIGVNRIAGYIAFYTHPDSTTGLLEVLRIDENQRVGIGTGVLGESANNKLDVIGSGYFSGGLSVGDTNVTSGIVNVGTGFRIANAATNRNVLRGNGTNFVSYSTGALTGVNDTNVTLSLGGTPAIALLDSVSITLGWTGTLAAARLNSNVVQSVVNDTNVTGSIATQALTLGWTGQLAISRGGTGASTATAAFNGLSPLTTLGDTIYHNGTNNVRLAGNTATAKKWLSQTGDGSVSAAPSWSVIAASDVTSPANLSVDSGLSITAGTGTGAVLQAVTLAIDQAFTPTWTALHTFNPGTTPANALLIGMAQPGTAGARDSHWIQWRGTSFDTAGHNADWLQQVDVTSNAAASAFIWQSRIDAASFTTRMTLADSGLLTVTSRITGLTQATGTTDAVAGGRALTVAGTTNRLTSSAGAQDLTADRTWTLDISASYVGQTSITTLGTITTGTWNGTDIQFANIQQIATASVLGRNAAGTGDIEVLTTLPSAVQDNITRVGTVTSGTWSATVISLAKGGTGADFSSADDWSLLTKDGSVLGAISPNITTTKKWLTMTGTGSAGAEATWDAITAADVTSPANLSVGASLQITAGSGTGAVLTAVTVNTIQDIQTTASPTFKKLILAGTTLTTDANNTIAQEDSSFSVEKNDTNTRTFFGHKLVATLNTGASNANTTVNLLYLDTTNTAATGLTTNLLSVNYGGSSRFLLDSAGLITVANKITGLTQATASTDAVAGGRSLTMTGTTNQVTISAGAQDLTANRTWTFSLPQDIHTGSSPTFAGLTIGSLTGMLKGASGVVSAVTGGTNRVTFWSDANTIASNSSFIWSTDYLQILDPGSGEAIRIRASHDTTGFSGIGFMNNADSATKAQIYWQASDNSFRFFHSGADQWYVDSTGALVGNGAHILKSSSGLLTITGTGGLILSTESNTDIALAPNGAGIVSLNNTSNPIFRWNKVGVITFNATNSGTVLQFTSGSGTGTYSFDNTIAGTNLSLSALTAKSVLFAGASGAVTQDNANLQYDSTGVSLGVGNTTSADTTLNVLRSGAKTVTQYGCLLQNTATSSTNSIDKHALHVISSGTWNGTSATNYGIYIATISGGTTNWSLYNASSANAFLGNVNISIGSIDTATDKSLNLTRTGAKTATDYGAYIASGVTSSTNSIDKYALYVTSTGTWNGTSAVNYGIYIFAVSGGTTNWALYNNTSANVYLGGGSVGIGTTSPASKCDITTNSLGVTQADTSGLVLATTTAAAAGAQQISPALRFRGFGWKTDATAASQSVDLRHYLLPVQGAAAPSGTLKWQQSINGGAYSDVMTLTTGGVLDILTGIRIGSAATSGRVLKGNGTNFISGQVDWTELTGVPSEFPPEDMDASKIVSGTFATARLGSGTADSSTFLRGDSSWAKVAQTLNSQFADVGNVGTGEDDLHTYTLAAGKLATNGDRVIVTATVTFAANSNTKTFNLYFAGTILQTLSDIGPNGLTIIAKSEIVRVSSTTVRATTVYQIGNTSTEVVSQTVFEYEEITGLTLGNSQVIKDTGEGSSNDDVIAKQFSVTYLPA